VKSAVPFEDSNSFGHSCVPCVPIRCRRHTTQVRAGYLWRDSNHPRHYRPQKSVAGISSNLHRPPLGRPFYYLFPNATAEDTARLLADYRQAYLARRHASTEVYPGVAEALSKLRGRKSTATTKGTPTTKAVLEQFGLISFFDHVQGTDGFPAKPNPDVVFKALEALGAQREDCLFVGDSASDMQAAKRAGVRSCAVTYGYGDADELARWQPDYVIGDLRELLPEPL